MPPLRAAEGAPHPAPPASAAGRTRGGQKGHLSCAPQGRVAEAPSPPAARSRPPGGGQRGPRPCSPARSPPRPGSAATGAPRGELEPAAGPPGGRGGLPDALAAFLDGLYAPEGPAAGPAAGSPEEERLEPPAHPHHHNDRQVQRPVAALVAEYRRRAGPFLRAVGTATRIRPKGEAQAPPEASPDEVIEAHRDAPPDAAAEAEHAEWRSAALAALAELERGCGPGGGGGGEGGGGMDEPD